MYCRMVGYLLCPNPNYPDDGYSTANYPTEFEYPWRLSDQCFSAVLKTYSPVVILSLVFSDILQPACWWLATDHSSRAAKVSERSTARAMCTKLTKFGSLGAAAAPDLWRVCDRRSPAD